MDDGWSASTARLWDQSLDKQHYQQSAGPQATEILVL